MIGQYILNGKTPKPEPDLMKWSMWMGTPSNRRVAKTVIGPVEISTVFLGIDHGFGGLLGKSPILFETMIFGGRHDQYQWRYATWAQAEAGHKKAVKLVNKCKGSARLVK